MKAIHAAFKSSCPKTLTNEIKNLECDCRLGLTQKQAAAHAVAEIVHKYKDTCRINEVVFALERLQESFGGNEETVKKIKEQFKHRFSLSPLFNEEALNLKAVNPITAPVLV